MKLHAVTTLKVDTSTLVLFAAQDDKKLSCDVKGTGFEDAFKLLEDAQAEGKFKGASKEALFFRSCNCSGFKNVLAVGLGAKKSLNEEAVRIGAAIAAKTLVKEKVKSAALALQPLRKLTKTAEGAGRAVSEGFVLGAYKYEEMKSKKKDDKETSKSLSDLYLVLKDSPALKKFEKGVHVGLILAEATNFARDLGNAPSNYMTPTILADRAHEAAKGLGIKFKALGKKECQALKMGCFLGVNKGSHEEPRFIVMEYFGGKKSEKPIAFVGKGLTFDTGGISIKPSANLEDMKFDMCGGAAVIATIVAIARLKLKVNVVGLVPSTENMPGGGAIKPGDVLVAMNGKTVEVNNTDAEGRLILADALAYACDHYSPRAIFDAATLTGACVIALGNVFSGFFTQDSKLLKQINESSQSSGERLWQLPLTEEYVDDMKGTYADLSNISSGKGGGSSTGAAFLSQFVTEGTPWAHFDIAPTAYSAGRFAYNPDKGATGVIVRLFSQLAMDL
ncbi:MAG: leucyl aminopeptidase [Oligoflexia bacterium]|nr:leucyl aminopeptidase [Oligoflexia bacterium]